MFPKAFQRAGLFVVLVLVTGLLPGRGADSAEFALIGDVPYTPEQITNGFPNLMAELNREHLAFVVHDGDIKAGATPCDDALFEERLRDFQASAHPFIYLFGDNEWTDCGKPAKSFNPEERLHKLRDMFTQGDETLGKTTLKLERQSSDSRYSKFRENVRWTLADVLFVGLNVPGAINNFGNKREFAPRNAANIAWLKESFAKAEEQGRRAVMIIFQANPFPERGSTNRIHAGFKDMISALEQETLRFGKPVVLVHGDSHYFRIDKPLMGTTSKRRIENFTRVETFGNPDAHWVHVAIDPQDPDVFVFRPRIVAGNRVSHANSAGLRP